MSRILDGAAAPGYPLVNVLGNAQGVVMTAEIPGLDPAELEISLSERNLTLRGEVKSVDPEGEGVIRHRSERPTGSFSRTFTLPFDVEEGAVSAKYDKGVLAIHLPRAEKSKPRTIPVTSN